MAAAQFEFAASTKFVKLHEIVGGVVSRTMTRCWQVLLFPLDLFPWPPMSTWVQAVFYSLNSLLWGAALAFLFVLLRNMRRGSRKK